MNTKSNESAAKVYFTGDLHFGHYNAIKYDCRPWPDVETMAAGMIDRWNARVTDDDLVYILGDVCYRSKCPAWHYPMAEWNGKTRGSWHIFAHIHAQRNEAYEVMKNMPHALNAGCMLSNFAPATFAELIANNQKFNAAD